MSKAGRTQPACSACSPCVVAGAGGGGLRPGSPYNRPTGAGTLGPIVKRKHTGILNQTFNIIFGRRSCPLIRKAYPEYESWQGTGTRVLHTKKHL